MGRMKNDGKGRLGGRSKGTPNKANATLRAFIEKLIDDNRGQIKADLKKLAPYQRLSLIEKLIGYVLPKQAPVSVDERISTEYKALEHLIDTAPDEFIDKITEKVLKMQEENNNG
ncbi:MAG: hypothetical protein LKG14_02165 [Prevotella sp.]|mgnify:CR=1 FL=1|jgi:hypothetical protein|uniref:Uncharacterized protein n=1 Tax=Segatella cerevisiae TaxID=2053716 RepID=A0ABT1BZS8_9BACT|nr:hypothetical protein [Segatella cerevisiae]MCH3994917.1 hypothetical protein [Prevotella sp.]MCI1246180.1 hypothetical protein [Prevotella sp.]MCO6026350.1 hypothetical protein [Segatella cerevisiae]